MKIYFFVGQCNFFKEIINSNGKCKFTDEKDDI